MQQRRSRVGAFGMGGLRNGLAGGGAWDAAVQVLGFEVPDWMIF